MPASRPADGVGRRVTTLAAAGLAGGLAARLIHSRRTARRFAPAAPPAPTPTAANQLRAHVSDLEAIADVTRELARSTDIDSARAAICQAASQMSGAEVAILFEPSPDGSGLIASASLGTEPGGVVLPFSGEVSGAVTAFNTRTPHFNPDVVDHPAAFQPLVERTGVKSAMWQPVVRDHEAIGVLTVAWRRRFDDLTDRLVSLMTLLAAEAAVAIDRADLLKRLETVARTDDLTGLPNRRCWEEELPRELARASRDHRPLCVAMLDLDQFKLYNDRHGHQAGDRLLREAAAAWRDTLRVSDLIARYGGEEFVVMLPGCPAHEAVPLVERLRISTPEGQSCSAGVAVWDGGESAQSLVGRADSALYVAKQAGRDRTVPAPVPG